MDRLKVSLELIDILKKESDNNHYLSLKDLIYKLSLRDIYLSDRKVIYSIIDTLQNHHYQIIYDYSKKGYYLDSSPFSKGDIKILIDSLNTHKELDITELRDKLYAFISSYNQDLISNNELIIKKKNSAKTLKKPGYFSSYSLKIETILNAIEKRHKIEMFHNSKLKTISPYFLYFSNSKYYIYDENLYSYRLDRIDYLKELDESYEYLQKIKDQIIIKIKTSYDNFDKNKAEIITMYSNNYEEIKNRLSDDFPSHYLNNQNRIIVEYKPNEIFFAKIVGYSGQLIIEEPINVRNDFKNYLESILKDY